MTYKGQHIKKRMFSKIKKKTEQKYKQTYTVIKKTHLSMAMTLSRINGKLIITQSTHLTKTYLWFCPENILLSSPGIKLTRLFLIVEISCMSSVYLTLKPLFFFF